MPIELKQYYHQCSGYDPRFGYYDQQKPHIHYILSCHISLNKREKNKQITSGTIYALVNRPSVSNFFSNGSGSGSVQVTRYREKLLSAHGVSSINSRIIKVPSRMLFIKIREFLLHLILLLHYHQANKTFQLFHINSLPHPNLNQESS